MQKIVPNLWFDKEAEEAANFYTSLFKNSKVGRILRYGASGSDVAGMPEGTVMSVDFELDGYSFVGINGGPIFKPTPAISFSVTLPTEAEIDALWAKLSEGGKALMPLDKYPFSEKYGWVEDKYGISWQIIIGEAKQPIIPSFLFVQEQAGKAEEAMQFYTSLFPNSSIGEMYRYGANDQGEKEDAIAHAPFTLAGEEFIAMDSSNKGHQFTFTPAISLMVNCETQEEVDHYWNAMSAVKEAEQCGWLQDKFGVSWQIVPTILNELITDPDGAKAERAISAMLKMHKLDIEELKRAADSAEN